MADPAVLIDSPTAGVRVLTLNLPHIRNAMTEDLRAAWTVAINQLAEDEGTRALVITGAGPTFCSGADLSWLDPGASRENTPDKLRSKMLPFYKSWLSARDLPFPVIAAVNGAAIGAGLALALVCDLRYAATDATFSAPFTRLGTHPGIAVTRLLPEAIGITRAREMLYTGRPVSAEEALSWGLVNGVDEDVVGHSIDIAMTIAEAAPIATRLTKAGLAHAANGLSAALEWEALAQPITMATADLHEGIEARKAHRRAIFTGE